MNTDTIKRRTIRRLMNLILQPSDENLIQMTNVIERLIPKNDAVRNITSSIRKAFEENRPELILAKNLFSRLSKDSKDKLIDNFFINAVILGKQHKNKLTKKLGIYFPWFFVISPSAKCNLHCTGCYASEYDKNEGLSFEEVDRLLTEAKQLGIYFITISGGEPFFWPHLLRIFEKHNDMYFQTYTNGTLIDKDLAKKLARLGNVVPAISVEGFENETEFRRGNGVYHKVLQAMDNLKEEGVLFGFSTTATRLNSDKIASDEFIDFMIEKGCFIGWYFQYVPIGRKPDLSLMARPEQRNHLRLRVNEIRNTKPIFLGDFWNDGPYVGGCLSGARRAGYFHINCNGDVEPCVFLQFSVDNIRNKSLLEIIQSPFFKAFQEAQPYRENKNLLTPCALIDNPQVLREIVKKYNAKPSYPSAENVIYDKEICQFLDNYSQEYRKLADPVWENGLSAKYFNWKEKKY